MLNQICLSLITQYLVPNSHGYCQDQRLSGHQSRAEVYVQVCLSKLVAIENAYQNTMPQTPSKLKIPYCFSQLSNLTNILENSISFLTLYFAIVLATEKWRCLNWQVLKHFLELTRGYFLSFSGSHTGFSPTSEFV